MARVLSYILVILLLFQLPAGAVQYQYDEELFDLISLGIVLPDENGECDLTSPVTRGEFAAMTIRLLNYEEAALSLGYYTEFSDLPTDHPYAPHLSFLVKSGYMNGRSASVIAPDDTVTLNEAVIILMRVLGYKEVTGNSPAEYMASAGRIGLLKDVPIVEKMTLSELLQLLYNALDVPPLEYNGVEYTQSSTTLRDGFKTDRHDPIFMREGIVTANINTFLKAPISDIESTQVEINGIVYNAEGTNAPDYLGMEVVYYVAYDNSSQPTIVSIYPTRKNEKLSVDSEDFINITTAELSYYDESNKKRSEKLAPGVKIVKNGRLLSSYTLEELPAVRGEYILIDNTGDGVFDILMIEDYFNVLVNKVSGSTVELQEGYKFRGSKFISYDADNDDIRYVFYDINKNEINISEVPAGSTLSIFVDKNNELFRFIVSEEKINGALTAVDEKRIYIDDTSYPYSAGDSFDFTLGKNVDVYIDYRGTVAFIKEAVQSRTYGYIVGYEADRIGSNAQIKMICGSPIDFIYDKNTDDLDDTNLIPKLICKNSSVEILDITKKTKINGVKYQSGGSVANGIYEYTLYSDGSVKTLDTPLIAGSGTTLKYNSKDKVFGRDVYVTPFAIADGTYVICVPRNTVSSDDDYMVPLEISSQSSSISYEVSGYEYNKDTKKVGLIVFKQEMDSQDVTKVKKNSSSVAVVKNKRYTSEDDILLTLVTSGGETEYTLKADSSTHEKWAGIKKGDMIYYSVKLDKTLGDVEKIYSCYDSNSDGFVKNEGAENEQYLGGVIDLSYNEIDAATYSLIIKAAMKCGGVYTEIDIPQRNQPPVFYIDKGNDEIRKSSLSEVVPGVQQLYIITNYGKITGCVILEK